jgi:hypothetical protein
MPVQFRSSAPCAASSMAERQALNLCPVWVQVPGGAPCGSEGNWHTSRAQTPRGLRVRLAPSAPDGHWENWQIRRALEPEFPGSRPGWPAAPPRTACGPAFVRREARFDTGWRLHVLVAQIGRGARSRAWRLRVRIPPGTPGPRVQRPDVPCKNGSRGWHSAGAPLGNGVTGSLLAFEATRCAFESRFPSSCLFSDNGQHATSVRR